MNREDEILSWKSKFKRFGIHELLALKEILEGIDKQNDAWYWEAQECLLQKKRQQDTHFNTVMVALEGEINHADKEIAKEYKVN